MLKEAIETIAQMAKRSITAEILTVDRNRQVLVHGEHREDIDYTPPAREHQLDGVADIVAMINECAEDPDKSIVWVGSEDVTLVLDDTDRQDVGEISLRASPQYNQLQKCKSLTQKELIQLLRIEAFGDVSPHLLGPITEMKWQTHGASGGHISHGKESLGRTVEAHVEGSIETIPEEVTCTVPVFDNPSMINIRAPVRCAVLLEHDTQRIVLHPKAMELYGAWRLGRAQLGAAIIEALTTGIDTEAQVPVMMGDPN